MLEGLRIILILVIMGGAIAFIGDKIGTKVGKRRMSLFGLRPRHTSIIVTIVTGIAIAGLTMGIMALASQNVRTALFGMDQLRSEMNQLSSDVQAKNQELEENKKVLDQSKKDLADKEKALTQMNKDVQSAQQELENAREARNEMSQQLLTVQQAYQQSEARLNASTQEVKDLEATRKQMEQHISNLKVATSDLEKNLNQMREGQVVFRVGEVLSGALIRPGLNEAQSEAAISSILKDTNGLILKRLGITEDKFVIYVDSNNLKQVAAQIAASKEPMTVRVSAGANIIYGEPALAEIEAFPYRLVFHKNDIIWTATIQGGDNAQYNILSFLKEVNGQAKSKGILPDPISGDVGSLPGSDLFSTIKELESIHGPVRIEAVAKDDTYTNGPVQIYLRINDI